jgi:hypothetical protein
MTVEGLSEDASKSDCTRLASSVTAKNLIDALPDFRKLNTAHEPNSRLLPAPGNLE